MTSFQDSWKGFYALFALPRNSVRAQGLYRITYYSLGELSYQRDLEFSLSKNLKSDEIIAENRSLGVHTFAFFIASTFYILIINKTRKHPIVCR